jgi:hypothetical protein
MSALGAGRCPNCDREQATEPFAPGCHVARIQQARAEDLRNPGWRPGWIETGFTLAHASAECGAHRVDWRTRALKAEAELAAAIAADVRREAAS